MFYFACSMANIPACYLGTAQTKSKEVMDGIFNREYRIVYITPEYATNSAGFIKSLAANIGKFNVRFACSRLCYTSAAQGWAFSP